MSCDPIEILACTSEAFVAQATQRGIHRPHSLDIYRRAFRKGTCRSTGASLSCAPIERTQHEHSTIKFVQRQQDGLESESVILPYRSAAGRRRNSLCVSSQIGCAMGCTFCETGQMGLMRNLSIQQIVGQWFAARFMVPDRSIETGSNQRSTTDGADDTDKETHPEHEVLGGKLSVSSAPSVVKAVEIDNIVFMGMGEPMDNLDAVIGAIQVLTDRNGASIAPAHISVSTVGRIEGILRLSALARQPGFRKLRLAVSINAPNDEIRSQIMPINRAAPMRALMDAMRQWPTHGRQRVLIEYVLIPGVNDALEHADELCAYLRPLTCTVNVIPYNPRRDSPWPAPTEQAVRGFVQRIDDNGQFVKRRQTLGRSMMGACGQLGNPGIRRRRLVDATLSDTA
jgi:23S rRNA (adenine2503-C2)-methyltransferase